ncbi:MAG: hypothetical protein LBV44_00730 [Methylobacillus sp.]|jgi:predicted RNA-binding Zn-ribbon protein involved in translation (DUF1610 family)|nr:hypothetical protein [Methylobacillus sp.]
MERGYKIRSKPDYQSLAWRDKALAHFVVAKGKGGMAVLQLFQQMYPREPVHVVYVRDGADDYSALLEKVIGEGLHCYDAEQEGLFAFYRMMDACRMGTQFYMAGSESFIWSAVKLAKLHGVQEDDVMKQIVATLARPVYCVHCKGMTPEVTTNIVACGKCGRKLFVRDHFSRLLGAYMGLQVDAENPGDVPAIEEIYR